MKILRQHNFIDLTGERFGSWKVIGLSYQKKWRLYWQCLCDCGNKRIIRSDGLKNAGENGYCSKCKSKNLILNISEISIDVHKSIRQRENGLFKNTIIVDGNIAYGYTSDKKVFIIDTKNVDKVSKYTWLVKGRGYAAANVRNKERYLHSYILENSAGGRFVDHKNLDKLDNRESNLRVCTLQQNAFNQGKPCTNTSGMKGVEKLPSGKWRARIGFCKNIISLGVYAEPEDAEMAYDFAATVLFGEFARTNNYGKAFSRLGPTTLTAQKILDKLMLKIENLRWRNNDILQSAISRIKILMVKNSVNTPEHNGVFFMPRLINEWK